MSVWLLPENIADILPREARTIERLRGDFLALVSSHGFETVRPPMIEYVDSLLTGTGSDLDLRTFKIVDQASGRLMGFRADMTPQAARIDAHILSRPGITRLCYAGSLLHARPLHPLASRQPYVCGVELFGSHSPESDAEVIQLGVLALRKSGINHIRLDLGHTGVVKAILQQDPAGASCTDAVMRALSHKDRSALAELAASLKSETAAALERLTMLFGPEEVLQELAAALSDYPEVAQIIEQVRALGRASGADEVSYDFADVHGYQYLTGVTFSVCIPQRCQAVLRGGRYDDIGAKFGRNRPAVGFTLYLRELASVLPHSRPYAILAPGFRDDQLLKDKIESLRAEGRIVVQALPEDTIASLEEAFRLDEELVFENGSWTVKARPWQALK